MAEPLISFYGDDFTGASAVMEALAFSGVKTVMFLEPPGADDLARFPDVQALGIAGVARSKDPSWMQDNLPDVFAALKRFGAPVAQYKVCSTFDSSPNRGSIGAAIDIGVPILGGAWQPLVVGSTDIGRYQMFGNLFAAIDGQVYRLDRHPIMMRHPATPMDEADLSRHLARQTDKTIAVLDFLKMKSGKSDETIAEACQNGAEIIAVDLFDAETTAEAGRLIWNRGKGPVFAIGSQGINYALVSHWRDIGILPPTFATPKLDTTDQLFCVSGSCSAITADQIDVAQQDGFAVVSLDTSMAVDPAAWAGEQDRVKQVVSGLLTKGRDVIVATAKGPNDPIVAQTTHAIEQAGLRAETMDERLGHALGHLVLWVRREFGLKRAVVAGGDTSGHAMSVLKAKALSAIAPLAPGSPLCRVHSDDATIDGLEVTLKGGQMGDSKFFLRAKGTEP